jgi:transcriptional regulator with XRE-family HTH domain
MNKLKLLRAESGLSLRELANKSTVDQSTISLLENDRQKAQITTLGKLAKAISESIGRKVTVEDLADLVDHSASIRGRKGGTPSHKNRQGQAFQAASAVSNVVPVPVPESQISELLSTMEKPRPVEPDQGQAAPPPIPTVRPARPGVSRNNSSNTPPATTIPDWIPQARTVPANRKFTLLDNNNAHKLADELGSNYDRVKFIMMNLPNFKLAYAELKEAVQEKLKGG